MKIFLGLTEIAGYAGRLWEGFLEIGVDSAFINIHQDVFQYGRAAGSRLVRLCRHIVSRRVAARKGPVRAGWMLAELAARMLLLVWAVPRFDVFIFIGGNSFLFGYDVPLLRLAGKKIVLVYLGSDERPPYLNGSIVKRGARIDADACLRGAREKRGRLDRSTRFADIVVSHVLSAQFHSREIVPFLWVGYPAPEVGHVAAADVRSDGAGVRILHAPSNPEGKGTDVIRSAVQRLRQNGYVIDYVEISGRPHLEVLQELKACDFVVDEVWSDTPLGGLATEAAAFGKPTVVGGYGWDLLRSLMPPEGVPPSVPCEPGKLEEAIEQLVREPEMAARVGQSAREFLAREWAPARVARRYCRLLEGERPSKSWVTRANAIGYFHGYGMPEDRLREVIRAVVRAGGREGLQLRDKPELETALLRFAEEGSGHGAGRAG